MDAPTVAAAPFKPAKALRLPMKKLLPPVLFILFAIEILIVDALVPQSKLSILAPIRHIGWLFIAVGIILLVRARWQFSKARTNIYTFDEPGILVTTGVFAFSRHPMYVGFTALLLGEALLLRSAPGLLSVAVFAVIADRWYIAFEERWLRSKFGEAYEHYAQHTRRWL